MFSLAPRALLVRPHCKKLFVIAGTRSLATVEPGLTKDSETKKEPKTAPAPLKFGFDVTLEQSAYAVDKDQRKLAVICGWMGATPRQLKPYKEFYAQRGYDVLSYAVGPRHVLQPQTALDLMDTVLNETLRPSSNGIRPPDKVVTHCFSVGGYLTGQMLRLLSEPGRAQDKQLYHQLVRAQIYDSPPDFNGIAKGIGKSMAMGDFVAKQVERALKLYLWAVRDSAGKDHRASSANFHDNHLPAPSLWLYSESDPVAPPKDIETVMAKWKNMGRKVESIVWDDTPHIQHARVDPDRYFGGLERFLEKHV